MAKIKCDKCYGTGKEPCEIHGSHTCDKCHGQGCVEEVFINPCPWRPIPNPKITYWTSTVFGNRPNKSMGIRLPINIITD